MKYRIPRCMPHSRALEVVAEELDGSGNATGSIEFIIDLESFEIVNHINLLHLFGESSDQFTAEIRSVIRQKIADRLDCSQDVIDYHPSGLS